MGPYCPRTGHPVKGRSLGEKRGANSDIEIRVLYIVVLREEEEKVGALRGRGHEERMPTHTHRVRGQVGDNHPVLWVIVSEENQSSRQVELIHSNLVLQNGGDSLSMRILSSILQTQTKP